MSRIKVGDLTEVVQEQSTTEQELIQRQRNRSCGPVEQETTIIKWVRG